MPSGSDDAGISDAVGRRGWPSPALAVGSVLLVAYLVPLVSLVVAQRPGAVAASVQSPAVRRAAATSLVTATVSTAISTAFGVPLAYWLARTDARAAGIVEAVVVVPIVLPPTVAGVVLLSVVGPGTALAAAAGAVGLSLTRSLAGVVIAQTFVASPFVVVASRAAFADVDRQLEEAARVQGAGPAEVLRRVTLPLAWPGVLAGVTLTFARALGEFGATLMLAYHPTTLPVQVWIAFLGRGLDAAYPVAVVLVALSLVALGVLQALGRRP